MRPKAAFEKCCIFSQSSHSLSRINPLKVSKVRVERPAARFRSVIWQETMLSWQGCAGASVEFSTSEESRARQEGLCNTLVGG